MTSIRQTNEFFNSEKQQCRINNIKFVYNSNLIKDERLVCSWCELMGASGIETLKLLEEQKLLKSNGFIGVDLEKKHIDELKIQRSDLQWYTTNIFDLLPKLNDVGILNLDIYGNVGYDKDYRDLSLIKSLIINSVNKFGEFIIFYNKDLDSVVRVKQKPNEALRYHSEKICQVFEEYLPNRKFDPLVLLPQDAEKKIEDGFTGQLGAYEIYKGKANGHRMANLRLIFR